MFAFRVVAAAATQSAAGVLTFNTEGYEKTDEDNTYSFNSFCHPEFPTWSDSKI
jgi:hypothetical protein